jgi:hypothetical protein
MRADKSGASGDNNELMDGIWNCWAICNQQVTGSIPDCQLWYKSLN